MYLKVLAFGAVALGLAAMTGPSRAMPVAPLGSSGIDSNVVEVGHKASHRRTTCVCPRTSSRGRVYGYREGYAPGATGRTYSYTERRYAPGRYGYYEEGRTYGGRYGTRYERSRGGAVYGERGARTRGEEGAIGRSVSPSQKGQQMQQRGKGMEPRGMKGEQPQGATTEKRSAQPGGTTGKPAGQQGSPTSKQPMQGGGTRGPSGPGGQSAPSGGGAGGGPGGAR